MDELGVLRECYMGGLGALWVDCGCYGWIGSAIVVQWVDCECYG